MNQVFRGVSVAQYDDERGDCERTREVRSFTRELGLPPHAYLVQVRLRKAAQLIRQGISLIEVAFETGFVDQSHLNRHFIKTYGVTPGTYRMAQ